MLFCFHPIHFALFWFGGHYQLLFTNFLFSSESVTPGHPDKLCDQVSDAILDAIMKEDPNARVACETATTTNLVVLLGEITTTANVNFEKIARDTILSIGYDNEEVGYNLTTLNIGNDGYFRFNNS